MNKYFSLLGLREDAGKDDVKAAYERRVRKYKSSDYDDDPEYVRKKLAELKEAYEQAYRMAGSGSSSLYRRDDFARSSASSFGIDGIWFSAGPPPAPRPGRKRSQTPPRQTSAGKRIPQGPD